MTETAINATISCIYFWPRKFTLENYEQVFSNQQLMATMVVIVVPIVCVYPFLQKYFVKGVMIGSIKG